MAYPIVAKASEVKAEYLYNLSDFTGSIPYNWVRLHCDTGQNEVYVVNPTDRSVRIFNDNGMEVYRFGDDEGLGDVGDVAVVDGGDLLLLSHMAGKYVVIRTDFRGEIKSRLELKNLPVGLADGFNPDDIVYRDGRIYLVDKNRMLVVVTGKDGAFVELHDLAGALGIDEKKRSDTGIAGFSLDGEGNMLFTVPTLFSAYVVSAESKVNAFGTRGSSPGKFNIVGGITRDANGNYFVVDTLRGVVMVFDKGFEFRAEFGFWGFGPGNLISPMDVAVSGDKVYVTQSRGRGISVYKVQSN